MFPGRCDRLDLGTVFCMRRREDHCLDRFIGQHLIERRSECDLMFGGKIAHRFGLERDAA